MDDDSNIWIETEETCYQCLSKAWPNNEQTQGNKPFSLFVGLIIFLLLEICL